MTTITADAGSFSVLWTNTITSSVVSVSNAVLGGAGSFSSLRVSGDAKADFTLTTGVMSISSALLSAAATVSSLRSSGLISGGGDFTISGIASATSFYAQLTMSAGNVLASGYSKAQFGTFSSASVVATLTAGVVSVSSALLGGAATVSSLRVAGDAVVDGNLSAALGSFTSCQAPSLYTPNSSCVVPSRVKLFADFTSGFTAQSTNTLGVIDGTNYPGYTLWFDNSRIAQSCSVDTGATLTVRMTTSGVGAVLCQLDASNIAPTFRENRALNTNAGLTNKAMTLTTGVVFTITGTVGVGAGFTAGKVSIIGWLEPPITSIPTNVPF